MAVVPRQPLTKEFFCVVGGARMFHVKRLGDPIALFHVKHAVSQIDKAYLFTFHVKQVLPAPLILQEVEHETTEKLGIEVGTFRRHALLLLTDFTDLLEGRRHDQAR